MKPHDLVNLFNSNRRGYLPLRVPNNADCEELDWSVRLDPVWPGCIPGHDIPGHDIMNVQIENGVPIPSKYQRTGLSKELCGFMAQLQPGQSFFVPFDPWTEKQVRGAMNNCVHADMRRKYVTRKTKAPPFGIRIWRLE